MVSRKDSPITGICIVTDRTRAPVGYEPILKAHDDITYAADVWKDGFFSMQRVYRYICICRSYAPGTFVYNVVTDIALANDRLTVPPGFTAIEYTEDTREKALRRKVLCIRTVSCDAAVDAVCDVILLAKQKKPPTGYTLAGELDGLLLCFKYGVIPPEFQKSHRISGGVTSNLYPNPALPYPLHPGSRSTGGLDKVGNISLPGQLSFADDLNLSSNSWGSEPGSQSVPEVPQRSFKSQPSFKVTKTVVDEIPFTLNAGLQATTDNGIHCGPFQNSLPFLPPATLATAQMERELNYDFTLELQIVTGSDA